MLLNRLAVDPHPGVRGHKVQCSMGSLLGAYQASFQAV